jgi:hypothetical protein
VVTPDALEAVGAPHPGDIRIPIGERLAALVQGRTEGRGIIPGFPAQLSSGLSSRPSGIDSGFSSYSVPLELPKAEVFTFADHDFSHVSRKKDHLASRALITPRIPWAERLAVEENALFPPVPTVSENTRQNIPYQERPNSHDRLHTSVLQRDRSPAEYLAAQFPSPWPPQIGGNSNLMTLSDQDLLLASQKLVERSLMENTTLSRVCNELAGPRIQGSLNPTAAVYTGKYRKVENRIRPVKTTLPEDFRIVRRIPSDPLLGMPKLPFVPPDFVPTAKFTQERRDNMNINKSGFMWPEEEKLAVHLVKLQEKGIAWDATERGSFRDDYFDPIVIPTIEHIPWVEKNIPIPPGIYEEVIKVLKEKIAIGVYEPSSASYRSQWFCVVKKDGKSLRLVHNLKPLNAVTIKDSGLPPILEYYAESLGGRGCYTGLDLFVAFDHRKLAIQSRDLTTFNTPLGLLRLTCMAMGATNSVQILQGDITFIMKEEIPGVAAPFMDDVTVKGAPSRYETDLDGWYSSSVFADPPEQECPVLCAVGADGIYYEVIPENRGIRRFVWEHLNDVNRVIQRVYKAGATFSASKMELCVPVVMAVGHRCSYDGRSPDDSKVQKIRDWPSCKSLTEVRGFLGTCGLVRIWVKDFAKKAKPLVILTKKEVEFIWTTLQQYSMDQLKIAVITAPCLRPIDYKCLRAVIMAVDSSWQAVGFILLQLGVDKRRYPSRFGSITWNEREQRYSQPKIEIYGLWRALRAYRLHIIGVKNFIVEVDAQYIKGMMNNPDIQPSAAVNRWIVGIKLFDFDLVHVPAERHTAPDGLSRRPRAPEDEDEEDDADDWLDKTMGFAVVLMNSIPSVVHPPAAAVSLLPTADTTFPLVSAYFSSIYSHEVEDAVIPRSKKAEAADDRIAAVEKLLKNPFEKSSGNVEIDEPETRQLVKYASKFFYMDGRLMKRDFQGRHKIVLPKDRRLSIMQQAHDAIGHKGVFSTLCNIRTRFWWPMLEDDVKWFVHTCHACQIRQTIRLHIPPTVSDIPTLFRKVHLDTMLMPTAGGYRYVVQARCAMSSWPEWRPLRRETEKSLGNFIFEEIFCRWGGVAEICTDNGSAYVAAVDYLAEKYKIHTIKISPYNSQANGLVESKHFSIREAIIKACDGDTSKWPSVAASVFWADRVTVRRTTGYSPFFMAHGVEPVLPLDIAEATYLLPPLDVPASTSSLIAHRAIQLQKRREDLDKMSERVLKARHQSVAKFIAKFSNVIRDYDFAVGTTVLVRNSRIEKELNKKTKQRYLGPMIVVHRTRGGSYILAEMDGAISRLRYAAFRVVPYYPRATQKIAIKDILADWEIRNLTNDAEEYPLADDPEDDLRTSDDEDD